MARWSFRKPITVDSTKVDADLTGFPVLVHLDSDSDLAEHAQASGDDIKFEDGDENQLSHEIESFNSSTGTLWAHVRVPSLSSTSDTTIFIYYGNSSADNQEDVSGVWDSDFVMVHHLQESSGPALDSAGNNNGTHFGNLDTEVDGEIKGAYGFDGVDDKVEIDDPPTSLGSAFTVTAWFKFKAGADGVFTPIVEKNVSSNRPSPIDLRDGGGSFPKQIDIKYGGRNAVNTLRSSATVSQDTWIRATVVVDDVNGGELYLNSSKVDSNPNTTFSDDNNRVIFGERTDGLGPAAIDLDEVRISSAVRTDAWVSTTYTNQDDPLSFYAVGAEEPLVVSKQAVTTTNTATTSVSVRDTQRNGSVSARGAAQSNTVTNVAATAPTEATGDTDLITTVSTPSVEAISPTALTTDAATTAAEQARASATTAQSTAIETKSRVFKFADAQAVATVDLNLLINPARGGRVGQTAITRSPLRPTATTDNRRSVDDSVALDPQFRDRSDTVQFREQNDDPEYET